MKLTRDQALDLLWDGECTELPGYAREATSQTGSGRWCSYHELVIRDPGGQLWATGYEQGLTESQDCSPFDDLDSAGAEFWPVEKVAVTTYEYRRKNA